MKLLASFINLCGTVWYTVYDTCVRVWHPACSFFLLQYFCCDRVYPRQWI